MQEAALACVLECAFFLTSFLAISQLVIQISAPVSLTDDSGALLLHRNTILTRQKGSGLLPGTDLSRGTCCCSFGHGNGCCSSGCSHCCSGRCICSRITMARS